MKKLSSLKEKKDEWNELGGLYQEVVTLGELLREEEDKELGKEMESNLLLLEKKIGKLQIESLLRGKNDHANAIISIHPGAGGTDSCDWAEILLKMYLGWTGKKGYQR